MGMGGLGVVMEISYTTQQIEDTARMLIGQVFTDYANNVDSLEEHMQRDSYVYPMVFAVNLFVSALLRDFDYHDAYSVLMSFDKDKMEFQGQQMKRIHEPQGVIFLKRG